ncbi:hypothetical protein WJX77_012550 [Trebouxia sp. C0004]
MVEARQAAESAWANAAPPCILPHHFKVVKRTRDASASNMLAAEDAKCCRLSPHPTAANDLAEGESGVSAHDHGLQTFSDSCADALDNATHKLLTMKRYMDMSDEELKELQFVLLVELQKLGTSVPVLVGEALLATDKRHCAALSALLRGRQYQNMASFFRTICKAAGHQVPPLYFASLEHQNSSEDDDEDEAGSMTFGKFVLSFMFYCGNSSRFREEGAKRQRRICEARRLLKGVIQDEVSSQTEENISEREADQYLEEWSKAEQVRARRNVPGGHPFSLRHGSDIPKRAVDLYSRIIKVKEFVEGVPLLANLSEKVIWDEINQHDNDALSVAASSSDTEIIDMSQHDNL